MNTVLFRARQQPRRYVPDLDRLLAGCERNYLTLTALLAVGNVVGRAGGKRALELVTLEEDRYTTTLAVQEVDPAMLGTASHWLTGTRRMIVRLYHDARLAEVLQWHNRRVMQGSYPYPNAQMAQRDEKQRVTDFLTDWLASCQRRRVPIHCARSPAVRVPPSRAGAP
jgi:uncharacterized protein